MAESLVASIELSRTGNHFVALVLDVENVLFGDQLTSPRQMRISTSRSGPPVLVSRLGVELPYAPVTSGCALFVVRSLVVARVRGTGAVVSLVIRIRQSRGSVLRYSHR